MEVFLLEPGPWQPFNPLRSREAEINRSRLVRRNPAEVGGEGERASVSFEIPRTDPGVTDPENEDISDHSYGINPQIHFRAAHDIPIDRNFRDTQSRTTGDIKDLHVETVPLGALTFKQKLSRGSLKHLKPALGIGDARQDYAFNTEIEKPAHQPSVPACDHAGAAGVNRS